MVANSGGNEIPQNKPIGVNKVTYHFTRNSVSCRLSHDHLKNQFASKKSGMDCEIRCIVLDHPRFTEVGTSGNPADRVDP